MGRSRIVVALLVALLLWSCVAVAAEPPRYRGRPLVDVLEELRSKGLELIYSSAVVGDDLIVTLEPPAGDPKDVLDAVLRPLGLWAKDGPSGSLLILPVGDESAAGDPTAESRRPTSRFVTEVVVTPNRHSVVRQEQAATHTIRDDDAVLAPTIGGDVSRIVELLPGVAAADNSAAFNVRGSTAEDVSMVLDGLELYDPYHLQSFQSPFSLVDSHIVDRIDFVGGGFTADLGDRHGGFVDIATHVPDSDSRGELELGTLNSRFAYQAPFESGAGSWVISARNWYPEAVRSTTELGGGEDLDPRFSDIYAKVGFDRWQRHRLSVHGLFSHDRLDFQESGEDVNESVEARTTNGYIWIRALSSWASGVQSESMLSGGRIDRLRQGVSSVDGAVVVADDRIVDFIGLKNHTTWRLSDDHALKAGFVLRWLEGQYRYSADVTEDPPSSTALALDPDGTSLGAHVAYRTRLGSKLTAEIGARWDRQTYTNDNQLSPRLNAVWRPGKRSEFRMALGRFNQSQRIHELHVEDGQTDFQRAEVAEQIELSYQVALQGGMRVRIDAYYRELSKLKPRYENLFEPVELFPETTEDRIAVLAEEARLSGVELLVRGDPRRRLFWWVNYTRSTAEDEIQDVDVLRSWDQPHAGKFLIGYRRDDRWSISLSGAAHTGWPTTPIGGTVVTLPDGSTELEPVIGPRNTTRFDNYSRLDFKARRSLRLPRGRLWFTLEVTNLTDRDNACCIDEVFLTPNPDGSVSASRLFDYWLGVTPSFSLRWEY